MLGHSIEFLGHRE